jgi:hypothetical protein
MASMAIFYQSADTFSSMQTKPGLGIGIGLGLGDHQSKRPSFNLLDSLLQEIIKECDVPAKRLPGCGVVTFILKKYIKQ